MMPQLSIGRTVQAIGITAVLAVCAGCVYRPTTMAPPDNSGYCKPGKGADAEYTPPFDVNKQVVIDAAEPGVCSSLKTHGAHDALDVVVINMNPFIFTYHFDVQAKPIVETAPVFFFQQLFGGLDLTQVDKLAQTVMAVGASHAPAAPHLTLDCDGHSDLLPLASTIVRKYSAVALQEVELAAALKSVNEDVKKPQADYKAHMTVVTNPREVTANVVPAAHAAEESDAKIAGITDSTLSAHEKEVSAFVGAARDFLKFRDSQILPSDLDNCTVEESVDGKLQPTSVRTLIDRADVVARDTIDIPNAMDAVRATNTAAKKDAAQIVTVLHDPLNFYRVRRIGLHTAASRDSIILERQAIPVSAAVNDQKSGTAGGTAASAGGAPGSQYITLAAPVVQFGPSRFLSIGAALSYSDIPTRQFGIVKQLQPSVVGDTAVSVIAISQNDSRRLAPMLTLNGHVLPGLCDLAKLQGRLCDAFTGVSVVLGATVNKAGATNLEFFEGLGVDLFDNRITVSGGYYTGQTQELAPGLLVGQRLPGSQTTVPVIARTLWRPALQLGFRIY